MRVQYMGGLWANSEDEVLKAAVMKYGMNQWARIASLLPRKSAKQCKARWCEWLSPDIRKTEWTREEEERLLHLAKIMPTQWRTIAPMIGRTAAQCLEHYERLLEDAQRGAGSSDAPAGAGAGAGAGASAGAPGGAGRSSDAPAGAKDAGDAPQERRGRFDHDTPAETKPARPDAVDMNEEEKEMLSEARARLANTRGKKAKRKAREKQLEAAKKMAQLQKRRELKAAGIAVKPAKLKKGAMDLSTEIPYEMEAAPGFYDTREEDEMAAKDKRDARGLGRLIEKYEDERTERTMDVTAKREAAKRRFVFGDPGDKSGPSASAQSQPEEPALKRSRLALPAPQVSDADLEAIAKAGLSRAQGLGGALRTENGVGRSGHDLLGSLAGNPVLATPLGSVSSSIPPTPSSAAREPWSEARDRQLRDIVKLQSASTPLIGGDNESLPESLEVDGSVTPRDTPRTPNPLATPSSISNESIATRDMEDARLAKLEKTRLQLAKHELKRGLDALPDPENEYQISLDATLNDDTLSGDEEGDDIPEDAQDEAKRLLREGKQLLEATKTRVLSSAAQKGLPIPAVVDSRENLPKELRMLIQRDIEVTNLLLEGEHPADELAHKVQAAAVEFGDCTEESLARARSLVDEEAEKTRLSQVDAENHVSEADILSALKERQAAIASELYVENENGEIVVAEKESDLKRVFHQRAMHVKLAVKSVKTQQKNLDVRLGGFESKWKSLSEELAAVYRDITKIDQEIVCFKMLEDAELAAAPRRIAELEVALEDQRQLEKSLQAEYAKLTASRNM